MQRIIQRFRGWGETCSEWRFGINGNTYRTSCCWSSHLLRDHEHKFEQPLEDQKLFKLCSDVGLKIVVKGQFFITLDEEEGPDEMMNLCREYTLPRSEEASRVRGWILGNTKIGPVLDVNVFIKNFAVLKSWSNLCFETEQLLRFELWTVFTNT